MISRWRWLLNLLMQRLWFRAGLFGTAAVATALVAAAASPLVPEEASRVFGADAVEDILKIIASSMLAVATFSLGTMVSAFAAAASTATPRASTLLIRDPTSQNVLSTFIGVFIFSLIGIIALNTEFYEPGGRAILFFFTLAAITVTLITFFRWIDYLSHLGRLGETIEKVERAATDAMVARCRDPYFASMPLDRIPPSVHALISEQYGYIQHLDVDALSKIAENAGGKIYVTRLPGAFADPTEPLAWTTWKPDDKETAKLVKAFLIENTRSFGQDPRFGLIVLSEIASRALSPGVNDPGTAIDIIGRGVRILSIWAQHRDASDTIEYKNVFVPAIASRDFFDDFFSPIARDGAGTLEIGIRLQKAFKTLAAIGPPDFRENARRHSTLALKRGLAALDLPEDRCVVQDLAAQVPVAEGSLHKAGSDGVMLSTTDEQQFTLS